MQKLTPQFLLKKLKRKLGIKSLNISFSDQELLDILYEDTIPTFSIYFPATYNMKLDLSKCRPADVPLRSNMQRAYHLELPYNMNVIEVEDVQYYESGLNDLYTPEISFGSSFEIFNNQVMQGMLESMMSVSITWDFMAPDILIVDQPGTLVKRVVTLKLLIEHSRDLSTLNYRYLDFIMKLFTLDAKIALFEDMKHSDKIDTTFNQIDLGIDKWEDAESQREDLLQHWDDIFLTHRGTTIYRS